MYEMERAQKDVFTKYAAADVSCAFASTSILVLKIIIGISHVGLL